MRANMAAAVSDSVDCILYYRVAHSFLAVQLASPHLRRDGSSGTLIGKQQRQWEKQ